MKNNPVLDCIDSQFIKAIEVIRATYRKHNLKYLSDSGIGGIIYGSNRHIVAQVRNREKHLPHLALVAFAKHFTIEMNYFYNEHQVLEFSIEDGNSKAINSDASLSNLNERLNKKIDDFILNLKHEEGNDVAIDADRLYDFKDALIEKSQGIAIAKTEEIISLSLDMSFTEIKKTNKTTTAEKTSSSEDEKIAFYTNMLEFNKIAIDAKDSENQTLKKYISRLETELRAYQPS